MLTEGKSLVEYIGPTLTPLNLHYQGALKDPMTFEANPAYDGRRIEEFRNHETAQQFLNWQNRGSMVLFRIATDLIYAGEREVVAGIVREVLGEELAGIKQRLGRIEKFMEKRGV